MEQFRKLGEALGSLRALMVFRDEIRINQRQCCLLADAFGLAFDSVADEIHHHLKPPDAKWKPLDHPLKELIRIFREGEHYIRQCLEARDWWARALSMGPNADSVELHLHNLLWCLPVVFEAVETAAESSDHHDDAANNRFMFSKKYEREWMEPNLFRQKFGRKYLAFDEFVRRLDTAWKEDQWVLSETITTEKRKNRLSDLLRSPRGKLHPCLVLVGSPELYQVRRRLGSGSSYKEIQWMGESFAVKHVIGDVESAKREIKVLSAVSHPNTMNCLYAFCDEEKRECFMVMDLMSKDLSSYIKETCGPRKRVPFSLLVAVDVMLQIARGMEYLHARKIFHGELNPSNVLVKPRTNSSQDGYLLVKVAGFGFSPGKNSKSPTSTTTTTTTNPCIWYSPEALAEQEQSPTGPSDCKFTEKSDVYSFAMICFELLTGKIPFEDGHLQGDRMSRNIRAGERPLFPFPSPKYLTGLTKRCWQTDPSSRPSFTCICRILRYIKRFLILNPDHGQQDPPVVPPVDYFELEVSLSKNVGNWARKEVVPVSVVPFQMYAYRVIEREKTNANVKERSSESGSEETSVCGDETPVIVEDPSPTESSNSARSSAQSQTSSDGSKKGSTTKKVDGKHNKKTGQLQKPKPVRTPQISCGHSMRMKPESQLRTAVMSPGGRRSSGHASDSELA